MKKEIIDIQPLGVRVFLVTQDSVLIIASTNHRV